MANERLMDFKEVKDYLGIGETTLRKLVRERSIPAFKIGGYLRFRRDELERWLEGHRLKVIDFDF